MRQDRQGKARLLAVQAACVEDGDEMLAQRHVMGFTHQLQQGRQQGRNQ